MPTSKDVMTFINHKNGKCPLYELNHFSADIIDELVKAGSVKIIKEPPTNRSIVVVSGVQI